MIGDCVSKGRYYIYCEAVMALETNSNAPKFPDLYEASILELQDGLNKGFFTSVDLVKVCIDLYQSDDTITDGGMYRHTLPGSKRSTSKVLRYGRSSRRTPMRSHKPRNWIVNVRRRAHEGLCMVSRSW